MSRSYDQLDNESILYHIADAQDQYEETFYIINDFLDHIMARKILMISTNAGINRRKPIDTYKYIYMYIVPQIDCTKKLIPEISGYFNEMFYDWYEENGKKYLMDFDDDYTVVEYFLQDKSISKAFLTFNMDTYLEAYYPLKNKFYYVASINNIFIDAGKYIAEQREMM